jgi:hypothetical protein
VPDLGNFTLCLITSAFGVAYGLPNITSRDFAGHSVRIAPCILRQKDETFFHPEKIFCCLCGREGYFFFSWLTY